MDWINHTISVRNIRGTNDRNRHSAARNLAEDCNASIICLVESKLEHVDCFIITQMLGARYDGFFFLPAVGTAGGIIVAWQTRLVTVTNHRVDDFSLTTFFSFADGGEWWHITVYGPTIDTLKPLFLADLREIRLCCNVMLTVAGDFDLILEAADKNQRVINRRMMGRFSVGNCVSQHFIYLLHCPELNSGVEISRK